MPNYRFISQRQREKLVGTLTAAVEQDPRYAKYLEAQQNLNREMERLSRIETDRSSPNAGLPHLLTREEAEELRTLLLQTASQGETLLAASEQKRNSVGSSEENEDNHIIRRNSSLGGMAEKDQNSLDLSEGREEALRLNLFEEDEAEPRETVPQMLNRLQDLLARDYDVLGAYDGEPPLPLQQIQEAGRSLTIDLRDRNLYQVGHNSSSRIPMTVVDGSGRKRSGFFTKASYANVMEQYNGPMKQIKALCNSDGQAELDKILDQVRYKAINANFQKGDMTPIGFGDRNEVIVGCLYTILQNYYKQRHPNADLFGRIKFSAGEIKQLLRGHLDLDPSKISNGAMNLLAEHFSNLANKAFLQIASMRMLVPDGTRLDNRSSAMSAVASLLGVSKLIARSDPMRCVLDDGTVLEGSFMEYAEGHDLFAERSLLTGVDEDPFASKAARKTLNRQIADLQVLDFLCMNEDRHPGNAIYQVNRQGMIPTLQGIDNDSSFSRRVPTLEELLSLGVVSETMKNTVMALQPETLRFALRSHGLAPEELEAAAGRLALLQDALQKKLLKVCDDETLSLYTPEELGHIGMKQAKLAGKVSGKKAPAAKAPVRPGQRKLGQPAPAKEKYHFRNFFNSLDEMIKKTVPEVHEAYGAGYPMPEAYTPEYQNVGTEDRVFTVGSLKDSLKAVSRLYKNKETGFKQSDLVNIHGKSTNFKRLMDAVRDTAALQQQLFDSGAAVPTDGVSLNEMPALSLRVQTDAAFDRLEELANIYLEGKRTERHAQTVETIQAKNPYEQRHIDHAKNILKAVAEYRKKTANPESEEARDSHMAQSDKHDLDLMLEVKQLAPIYARYGRQVQRTREALGDQQGQLAEQARKLLDVLMKKGPSAQITLNTLQRELVDYHLLTPQQLEQLRQPEAEQEALQPQDPQKGQNLRDSLDASQAEQEEQQSQREPLNSKQEGAASNKSM